MPKVSDAHRERRRDQILDGAVACFLRRGVRATTMAEIIAESGLSAGAIYGYFESKQELALAVMHREAAGRAAEIDATAEGRAISPGRMVRILADTFVRHSPNPALVVQMWGEAASDPEFQAITATAFAEIGKIFGAHLVRWAEEVRDFPAEEAARWSVSMRPVLLALVQGLILQGSLVPEFDRESYLAGIDQLFGVPGGEG